MAYRKLTDDDVGPMSVYAWTQLVASSGNNAVIDVTDQGDSSPYVGATGKLTLYTVMVQNLSSNITLAKIIDSDGDLIFAATLAASQAMTYTVPVQLAAGKGLSVNLDGTNSHRVTVQYAVE